MCNTNPNSKFSWWERQCSFRVSLLYFRWQRNDGWRGGREQSWRWGSAEESVESKVKKTPSSADISLPPSSPFESKSIWDGRLFSFWALNWWVLGHPSVLLPLYCLHMSLRRLLFRDQTLCQSQSIQFHSTSENVLLIKCSFASIKRLSLLTTLGCLRLEGVWMYMALLKFFFQMYRSMAAYLALRWPLFCCWLFCAPSNSPHVHHWWGASPALWWLIQELENIQLNDLCCSAHNNLTFSASLRNISQPNCYKFSLPNYSLFWWSPAEIELLTLFFNKP